MTPKELADILIEVLREHDYAYVEPWAHDASMTQIDGRFDMERVAAEILRHLEPLEPPSAEAEMLREAEAYLGGFMGEVSTYRKVEALRERIRKRLGLPEDI